MSGSWNEKHAGSVGAGKVAAVDQLTHMFRIAAQYAGLFALPVYFPAGNPQDRCPNPHPANEF
ncbi:hypothetical protein ACLEBW_00040 [Klebsiella pneumoniae]|uniref:hypothetical protein n=1 Tax=Klebsiella pneumoniae TaxID=573 RepID=UPI003976FF9F